MNLDDRQPELGTSKLWIGGTIDKPDQSVPLRWDALHGELMLDYFPLDEVGRVDRSSLLAAIREDRQLDFGVESVQAMYASSVLTSAVHAYSAELVYSYSADDSGVDEVITTIALDRLRQKVASGPNRYTIDIIKGRALDEREIRGAKRQLQKSKLRNLSATEFARRSQHIGCGNDCKICAMVRGSMRWVWKCVDKFVDTRPGYCWDLDFWTVNVRSRHGRKYAAIMRDSGSKVYRAFTMPFKSDFGPMLKEWVQALRKDPVVKRYDYLNFSMIHTGNDGVWDYKCQSWQDMCSDLNIMMDYGCTDRDEDVAEGERSVQEAQHITKKGLFARNCYEWWWEEFLEHTPL